MVIIPLTRQVCKGASPEPEPLSAQRARSCKYVSVSIGALAWEFYTLNNFISVRCIRSPQLCFSLSFQGGVGLHFTT